MTKSISRPVLLVLSILCFASSAFAGEIREFDLKTIERLGNELTRVSQTRDKGATTPERKRAKQTAIAALKGKLFNIHYEYVVLGDPDGSGILVYALGATKNPDEVVLAGHFRVTISADGEKAQRIDALSRSLNVVPKQSSDQGLWIIQLVSDKPVETLVYLGNLHHCPIFVGTLDRRIWEIQDGKMRVVRDNKHVPSHPNH